MKIRILPRPPDWAIPILEEDRRKQAFFADHRDEFRQRYPDQFVAVKDGEVVLADGDLDEFDRRLREIGLGPKDVWVKYMGVTKRNYIL